MHISAAEMMEILRSKYDQTSECICVWLKEVESCGFRSFAINYEALDQIQIDRNQESFVVEDPFVQISPEQVTKYEREDGLDENAGLKGNCSVFLQNGYELNGKWRNGKREGPGLICGQSLEEKGAFINRVVTSRVQKVVKK